MTKSLKIEQELALFQDETNKLEAFKWSKTLDFIKFIVSSLGALGSAVALVLEAIGT